MASAWLSERTGGDMQMNFLQGKVSNVHTIQRRLKYCPSTSGCCEGNLAILDFGQITDFKQDRLNPRRNKRRSNIP